MDISNIMSYFKNSLKTFFIVGGVLIMIIGTTMTSYSSTNLPTDQWLTPMEAYGINGDINDPEVYMELKNEFEISPPGAVEFTIIAVGTKYFDELQPIENQKILSVYGYTPMFHLGGEFEEFSSNSSVTLCFEEGEDEDEDEDEEDEYEDENYEALFGWYAHSFSIYYPKEKDTGSKDHDLEQQEYEKCNIFSSHLEEENYKYKEYIEPDSFYIEIPLPFGYHVTSGENDTPNSGTKVLARIDRVKMELDINPKTNLWRVWELQRIETYFLKSDDEVGTTVRFDDNWSGKVDHNHSDMEIQLDISVKDNTVNYIRTTNIGLDANNLETRIENYTITFGLPPTFMKTGDPIKISISQSGTITDFDGKVSDLDLEFPCAGFLPGLRQDSFSITESSGDKMGYVYGAELDQMWFAKSAKYLKRSAPYAERDGEFMTLELGLDNCDPIDITKYYTPETPVIAYIYKWKEGNFGGLETESDEFIENNSDNVLGTDVDDGSNLNKFTEDTKIFEIGGILALTAIIGAAVIFLWRRKKVKLKK